MLNDFSGGYYHTIMNVQEYDDGPVIERSLYEFIENDLYRDSECPVMMRVGLDGGPVFAVDSESAVPQDVLAVPPEIAESDDAANVFVLKSEYCDTIGEYYG